jgi:predicted O-methyltransferase YrrM
MSYTAADAITYLVQPDALQNLVNACSVPGTRAALIGFNEYSKNLVNLCPDNVVCVYDDERWKQGIRFKGIPVLSFAERADINKIICCAYGQIYEGMPAIRAFYPNVPYYYPPQIEYKDTGLLDISLQERLYREIASDVADCPPGMMIPEKMRFLVELLRQGLRNPGAIIEMGVWQGAASWHMAKALAHLGEDRDLYMIDLFESHAPDRTATMCNDQIKRQLSFYPKAQLMMGLVDDEIILSQLRGKPLCFVHFDLGFIPKALEFVWDHLQPGSFLLLDNYGHIAGEPWLYDEFFSVRGRHVVRFPWSEQGLVVR